MTPLGGPSGRGAGTCPIGPMVNPPLGKQTHETMLIRFFDVGRRHVSLRSYSFDGTSGHCQPCRRTNVDWSLLSCRWNISRRPITSGTGANSGVCHTWYMSPAMGIIMQHCSFGPMNFLAKIHYDTVDRAI